VVAILDLWLPMVLSAVAVFAASSLIHMLLGYHAGDKAKLPGEDAVMKAILDARVPPGNYMFPHCAGKKMNDPALVAKFEKGPVGLVNVLPSGPPTMGRALAQWFVYCLVAGLMTAYLTGRTLGPGTPYLAVFRVAGTTAFLFYAGALAQVSIWGGQRWAVTLKHILDALIYSLLTAGLFGWLWPR